MSRYFNFSNNIFDIYMTNRTKVAVVFDLDETIGHFWQIGNLWEAIKYFKGNKFSERDFHKILDLFPHVFRPGIFNVFKYLKAQKIRDRNIKIVVYSNNQGPPAWAKMITKYIEKKINYKNLFDKVITAWKVNGIIYNKCRRTNEKTYSEIVRCARLNKQTEIFFVDDAYHPRMYNSKTDYMHIKDWKFGYNIKYMVEKFLNSDCCKKISNSDKEFLMSRMPNYMRSNTYGYINYTNSNKPGEKDRRLGKKLLTNIKDFLKEKNKKSLKNKNRTRRRYTRKR